MMFFITNHDVEVFWQSTADERKHSGVGTRSEASDECDDKDEQSTIDQESKGPAAEAGKLNTVELLQPLSLSCGKVTHGLHRKGELRICYADFEFQGDAHV